MANGTYSSEDFTYHKEAKTFIAELSELHIAPGETPLKSVLDSGNPVLGIVMVSALTGASVAFKLEKIDETREDIDGWNFTPTADSLKEHPGCEGVKVLLIND